MINLCLQLLLLTLVGVVLAVESESPSDVPFLVSYPNTLVANTNETFCVFTRAEGMYQVSLSILERKESLEIASVSAEFTGFKNCHQVSIPSNVSGTKRIQVKFRYKTSSSYVVKIDQLVYIHSDPYLTFLETDKPVYNKGQVVRLRGFTVRSDLTPVFQAVHKIWIENPQGIHIAQWLNVTPRHGFVEGEMQLSQEPMFGVWTVKFQQHDLHDVITRSFQVLDYLPPRFSVDMRVPDTARKDSNLNITVCARYTFGEPVHGKIQLEFTFKCSFLYYCRTKQNTHKQTFRLGQNGCLQYSYDVGSSNATDLYRSLQINATVKEEGTGIKMAASRVVRVESIDNRKISVSVRSRYFKLGIPFFGEVSVDESLLPVPVKLCLVLKGEDLCKETLAISSNFSFYMTTPPQVPDDNLKVLIKASVSNYTAVKTLLPWYSPSGSYLHIVAADTAAVPCKGRTVFTVLYSIASAGRGSQFHYIVKSRGDIIDTGHIVVDEPQSYKKEEVRGGGAIVEVGGASLDHIQQFQLSLNVTENWAPTAHLLVYHMVHGTQELVADSLAFPVENCLQNQVELRWVRNRTRPGSRATLSLTAAADSWCSISVVDKSVRLMVEEGGEEETSKDAVFRRLNKYKDEEKVSIETADGPAETGSNDAQLLSIYPHPSSFFVDSLQAFQDAGIAVMSNLNLQTKPRRPEAAANGTMRYSPEYSGLYDGAEVSPLQVRQDVISSLTKPGYHRHWEKKTRFLFPETSLWSVVPVGSKDKGGFTLTLPHSITSWDASTVCLSSAAGLGISQHSSITTFQPMFVDFTVPESVRRREQLHLKVTVFNYHVVDLPIKITLISSESMLIKSSEHASYCISTHSKVVHTFHVDAVRLGEARLEAHAEVDSDFPEACGGETTLHSSDTVMKTMQILPEGIPVEDTKSGLICGLHDNFQHAVEWNMELPADIVESSISVSGYVSGDVLGPVFNNVKELITLPTGCGEQNMVLLVPNLLLLEYLLLEKDKDVEHIEKALRNLDSGYQRQLNYRLQDGSYSAFGEDDKTGSIWLTAFVVRYLSQADKFIHIDKADLMKSIKWIVKHQLENGCFPVVGKIYHNTLQGKLEESESSKTLTAYVLISLMESGLAANSAPVVRDAIYCLNGSESGSATSRSVYGDLVTTYALLLAGEIRVSQGLVKDLLDRASREYQRLWWEDEESSIESSIEMTSYGILSLVKLGGPQFLAAAADAVRWISQFRNKRGGFRSTQDTIVALEAISKFSATLPKMGEPDQLQVEVSSNQKKKTLTLIPSNRTVQQEIHFPPQTTVMRFNVSGKGCALVQAVVRYNMKRGRSSDLLKIQLKMSPVSSVARDSIQRMHLCVKNKGKTINMAVLEVATPTGFVPDRTSLYAIHKSRQGVRRWEEYEEKVNFYLEGLSGKKTCVDFLVVQETCVSGSAPAAIHLYDYYNTAVRTSMKYSISSSCNLTSIEEDFALDPVFNTMSDSLEKTDRKRELNESENTLEQFVDLSTDLEAPFEDGPMPVYVMTPPPQLIPGRSCPQCFTAVPDIFPQMYCSSQVAVKVLIRSKEHLTVLLDVTPRKNVTILQKAVSFTVKRHCVCDMLNTVNSYALLLVAPPRTLRIQALQEMHLDDAVQLFPIDPEYMASTLPQYISDAIKTCHKPTTGGNTGQI